MKRSFSLLVMSVVGVIVVVFSTSNHSLVILDFWPLPILQETPIYIPVLATGFFGFLFGGIVSWFSGGNIRKKARNANRQVSNLEKDLAVLQNKIDDLDDLRKKGAPKI